MPGGGGKGLCRGLSKAGSLSKEGVHVVGGVRGRVEYEDACQVGREMLDFDIDAVELFLRRRRLKNLLGPSKSDSLMVVSGSLTTTSNTGVVGVELWEALSDTDVRSGKRNGIVY